MEKNHSFLTNLIADIDIPAEGTLSKVVFKNDQIRVVLFAFDTGQELTEHTAARPALVQVLSGLLRLTMGADSYDCGPGDWAHMDAKLTHALKALEPTVMLLTMLPFQSGVS